MEKKVYNFSDFTTEQVESAFQLTEVRDKAVIDNWLTIAQRQKIEPLDNTILDIILPKLKNARTTWNEDELKIKFLSPLLMLIDFDMLEKNFASFSERWLRKDIKNYTFQGKVDWMIASGKYEPKQPFFFIHEYKRGVGSSKDPAGQLLAAMCIAQTLNAAPSKIDLFNPTPIVYEDLPIYGCYVIGHLWYFVVLKNKNYFISRPYHAIIRKDLEEIVKLLKAQKEMILAYVGKYK